MVFKGACLVVCALAYVMGVDAMIARPGMAGGITAVQTATAEVQTMVTSVKAAAEMQIGRTFSMFEAVSFRTQVVSGTNYFVKVHVGARSYIHLRIHRTLQGQIQLASYKTGLTRLSPITFF